MLINDRKQWILTTPVIPDVSCSATNRWKISTSTWCLTEEESYWGRRFTSVAFILCASCIYYSLSHVYALATCLYSNNNKASLNWTEREINRKSGRQVERETEGLMGNRLMHSGISELSFLSICFALSSLLNSVGDRVRATAGTRSSVSVTCSQRRVQKYTRLHLQHWRLNRKRRKSCSVIRSVSFIFSRDWNCFVRWQISFYEIWFRRSSENES